MKAADHGGKVVKTVAEAVAELVKAGHGEEMITYLGRTVAVKDMPSQLTRSGIPASTMDSRYCRIVYMNVYCGYPVTASASLETLRSLRCEK